MSIEEIRLRRAAIDGAPWKYENIGQTVFGRSLGGCNKDMSDYMVANIRGWGHLQYMGKTRGDGKAQAMQDANGEFIAQAPDDVDALLAEVDRLTRAARVLRAAAEDARMILADIPRHCLTPNQNVVATQTKTNLDHAIRQAQRSGIERATTIEGE